MLSIPLRTLGPAGALAILIAGASAGRSEASIIYAQTPGPNVSPTWTSHVAYDPSTSTVLDGYRTYDNFTLSADAWVTTVTWRGISYDFVDTTNNPVPLSTQFWQLDFFNDALGLPGGATIGHDFFNAGDVTTTFVGTAPFGTATVNVYDFAVTLAAPVFLQANTQYWFSAWSLGPQFNPIFGWYNGLGGDGLSWQDGYGAAAGTATFRDGDRAFTLQGTEVPEPATLGLLATGLGALIVRRRATMAGPSASWPDRTPSDRRARRAGN